MTFTTKQPVRITDPSHPLCGNTGTIIMLVYAYTKWPSDLLYLQMTSGSLEGQTYKVWANQCSPVEVPA